MNGTSIVELLIALTLLGAFTLSYTHQSHRFLKHMKKIKNELKSNPERNENCSLTTTSLGEQLKVCSVNNTITSLELW